MTQENTAPITNDAILEKAFDVDFDQQLDTTFSDGMFSQGGVVRGVVTQMDSEYVHVDIGMKAAGRIQTKEFINFGEETTDVKVGDEVQVFVDNLDNRHGEAQLSREKAKREEMLDTLEKAHKDDETVTGILFGKVKGGFMVDVQGILGFMPGSQLDARPLTDATPYMHNQQELKIVKCDRARNNFIVSRRAVQDEENSGSREEILGQIAEGKVMEGVVKNVTDYGAFVDLGGIDGLLHITDMAWHRIQHPSEILKVGGTIDVMVIRFDPENQRVSLGLKQMQDDPWSKVEEQFPLEARVAGKVTNVTDYGAFVELAPGIEGLIHVSEMSWTRKNAHPNKIVTEGQEVSVLVMEIDRNKRRISLGLKQTQDNPWQAFEKENKVGDKVKGTIRSMTDFGVFVGLTEEIDGLVHVSDLSWEQSGEEALQDLRKGDEVEAVILALDADKERIALGIKQMANDPFSTITDTYKKGQVVNVKVTAIESSGLTVDFEGFDVYIRARDLGVDREEQDTNRYKEGQEIEAKLTNVSAKDRKISLSVKALMIDEEKSAVAEFGDDVDDGDSALAAALKQAGVAAAAAKATEAKPAKKAAVKKPAAKKAPAKKKEAAAE